jgi:WD40 repeat protein
LDLSADFNFRQGQLFINNDVVVSGTSSFVYSSPSSSFITHGGTLAFDHGTTFSFAPATASKDLLIMQDPTSVLKMNGCTLKCTDTGFRLTSGTLLFDNKVVLDSLNATNFSTASTVTSYHSGGTIRSLSWSPNKSLLAVGFSSSPNNGDPIHLYAYSDSTLTLVDHKGFGSSVNSIVWSPDGRFLAVGGAGPVNGAGGFNDTNNVRIYSFNGSSLTPLISISYGNSVAALSWSPDGRYIAIGGDLGGNSSTTYYYSFNGINLTYIGNSSYSNGDYRSAVTALAWHPSGSYCAVGSDTFNCYNNNIFIYAFNPSGNASLLWDGVATSYSSPYGVSWSPDGKYLAVTSQPYWELHIYAFDGTTVTWSTYLPDDQTAFDAVAWSGDGRYLFTGGKTGPCFRIYSFDGTNINYLFGDQYGTTVYAVASSVTENVVAIGGTGPTSFGGTANYDQLQLYEVVLNESPESNGIVFGNSSLGSSANNLNVKLLSGARVEINGEVRDDSV